MPNKKTSPIQEFLNLHKEFTINHKLSKPKIKKLNKLVAYLDYSVKVSDEVEKQIDIINSYQSKKYSLSLGNQLKLDCLNLVKYKSSIPT